jgi:ankyrin repeat protein
MLAELIEACKLGNVGEASRLLGKGAAPTYAVRNGDTPLHHAASMGHEGIVELLLDSLQDEDNWINLTNNLHRTPLWDAVRCDDAEVVRLLVGRGADVRIGNQNRLTPLGLACK